MPRAPFLETGTRHSEPSGLLVHVSLNQTTLFRPWIKAAQHTSVEGTKGLLRYALQMAPASNHPEASAARAEEAMGRLIIHNLMDLRKSPFERTQIDATLSNLKLAPGLSISSWRRRN